MLKVRNPIKFLAVSVLSTLLQNPVNPVHPVSSSLAEPTALSNACVLRYPRFLGANARDLHRLRFVKLCLIKAAQQVSVTEEIHACS